MNDEVSITMENIVGNCGYLELIAGPMYSGKTSKLLDIYKKYNFCEMKTLVINYAEDTRYSPDMLSTHEKIMIPCVMGSSLKEISDIVNSPPTKEFVDWMEISNEIDSVIGWNLYRCVTKSPNSTHSVAYVRESRQSSVTE